jgi:Zn-dependent metalloprotease
MRDPARPGLSCGEDEHPFTQRHNTWGNGKPADLKTVCVDAMYAAATQWDMLRAWLGRNGFDGKGHAARIEVGYFKPGAFFQPPELVLIGVVCRRLATPSACEVPDPLHRQKSSMDIVGHEFGHMVFDTTPGGRNDAISENTALAEGTGDIFGQLTIAFADNPRVPLKYTIGSQYGPPERTMYHPSLAGHGAPDCWSPNVADLPFSGQASGPLNHWFYLLAEGTTPAGLPASPTCDRSTLTGLGIQLAGKIWYHALLLKTHTWEYREARSATLTAAKQLFPGSCTVFDKVKAAWNAVSVPAPRNEPACITRHT